VVPLLVSLALTGPVLAVVSVALTLAMVVPCVQSAPSQPVSLADWLPCEVSVALPVGTWPLVPVVGSSPVSAVPVGASLVLADDDDALPASPQATATSERTDAPNPDVTHDICTASSYRRSLARSRGAMADVTRMTGDARR
jgi:hypothetical protein